MVSIREYLQKQGYNTVNDETVSYLEIWEDWYSGYVKSFHSYNVYNGINMTSVDREYLGMAKTVSEDWANLLLNEKVQISTNSTFDDKLNEVFEYNNFRVKSNQLMELSFAFGTGAFVEYLDDKENVVIDFIRAGMIYPLSWDNGYINECAFGSVRERDGNRQYYIQIHKMNERGLYVIENHLVDAESGKQIELDEDIAEHIETGSDIPLFQIITPNIVNNIDLDSPLGISVFGNAIGQLKGCDIVYDSYMNEFNLGKKRITIPLTYATIQLTEDGIKKPVFDNNDTLFYALPCSDDNEGTIQEINMTIRAQEHEMGINKMLDLLSFKCGLGSGRYKFENGGVKTATEVISDKSELYQNLAKHKITVESALKGLVNAIAYLTGNQIQEINIDFDDSIIIDENEEKKQDLQEIALGLMQKWEYRVKHKGESEEVAKQMAGSEPNIEEFGD